MVPDETRALSHRVLDMLLDAMYGQPLPASPPEPADRGGSRNLTPAESAAVTRLLEEGVHNPEIRQAVPMSKTGVRQRRKMWLPKAAEADKLLIEGGVVEEIAEKLGVAPSVILGHARYRTGQKIRGVGREYVQKHPMYRIEEVGNYIKMFPLA